MIQMKVKRAIKAHDEEEASTLFFDELQELYDSGEVTLSIRKMKNDDDEEDMMEEDDE